MGTSTLQIALTYLIAALVAVPIARRLGLSAIVGYLLAGALIGPFCFGLVGDQSAVMRFAEYGVVVMLFLIGLELKADELWQQRAQIFGVGLAQMMVTAVAIALCLSLILSHFQSALAIGMILALSSTALVLQTYQEKGWTRLAGGRTGFATLLFQDIVVIPIIIFLPLLAVPDLLTPVLDQTIAVQGGETVNAGPVDSQAGHHGQDDHSDQAGHHGPKALAPIYIIALSIVGLVAAGHYLVRPAFRAIAASRAPELFTIGALAIIVGVTMLMEEIGLSPALGGFLAGVVLAENEYRHEIETDLEPFRGLLLGLFFLTVGASLDVDLLRSEALVILGSVLGLIMVKAGIAYAVAGLGSLKGTDRMIYALSLAQGGEFAFVLFGLAVSVGVLPVDLSDRLTLIVTLSMLLSPFVIMAYENRSLWKRAHAVGGADAPAFDAADNRPQEGDVIVAGFGRFGQIVTRLLRSQGYNPVVLDYDASQVETVRKFGATVFYGDASREDLLRSAGAERAKLLVIAVDLPVKSLEIVDTAQKHFPGLKIVARARNRQHAYELIRRHVHSFERETFLSSLEVGIQSLMLMGQSRMQARKAAARFRAHDEKNLLELEKLWGDDRAYGLAVSRSFETLMETLAQDEDEYGDDDIQNGLSPEDPKNT